MTDPQVNDALRVEDDDRIHCGRCRALATPGALAVRRNGAHEQTLGNP